MKSTGSKKNLKKSSVENDRKSCVERDNSQLTVKRQSQLLSINRTSIYRKLVTRELDEATLSVMHRIDEIHTAEPTWGYRSITWHLRREYGLLINRKKVRRLMQTMGIYAIYPKPNLSKRYHAQYIRPYLLRNLAITRPDQVWGVDITYIRMPKGFMYLFIIIDWYSRYIVDYELSSTLEHGFVLTCLKRALTNHKPEIINSDQGSHFTNPKYIECLEKAGVRISMDGKGQCLDNARTERFFRSLKYERIYIDEYNTPRLLRAMLKDYIHTYNQYRPHSALGGQFPVHWYEENKLQGAVLYQTTRKGA